MSHLLYQIYVWTDLTPKLLRMDIKEYIRDNTISILVKPNAPKTEILGWDEDKQALRMNVKAQPEKGKANLKIVKFFKKQYKIDVVIVSGAKSHRKILSVVE